MVALLVPGRHDPCTPPSCLDAFFALIAERGKVPCSHLAQQPQLPRDPLKTSSSTSLHHSLSASRSAGCSRETGGEQRATGNGTADLAPFQACASRIVLRANRLPALHLKGGHRPLPPQAPHDVISESARAKKPAKHESRFTTPPSMLEPGAISLPSVMPGARCLSSSMRSACLVCLGRQTLRQIPTRTVAFWSVPWAHGKGGMHLQSRG